MVTMKLSITYPAGAPPSARNLEAAAAEFLNSYHNSGQLADTLNQVLRAYGKDFALVNNPSGANEIKFEVEKFPFDRSSRYNNFSFKSVPTMRFKR